MVLNDNLNVLNDLNSLNFIELENALKNALNSYDYPLFMNCLKVGYDKFSYNPSVRQLKGMFEGERIQKTKKWLYFKNRNKIGLYSLTTFKSEDKLIKKRSYIPEYTFKKAVVESNLPNHLKNIDYFKGCNEDFKIIEETRGGRFEDIGIPIKQTIAIKNYYIKF